jgi:hypothetical protein
MGKWVAAFSFAFVGCLVEMSSRRLPVAVVAHLCFFGFKFFSLFHYPHKDNQ